MASYQHEVDHSPCDITENGSALVSESLRGHLLFDDSILFDPLNPMFQGGDICPAFNHLIANNMVNEIAVFNAYFAVRPIPDIHEAAEAIK
jgi:hypothetical protein